MTPDRRCETCSGWMKPEATTCPRCENRAQKAAEQAELQMELERSAERHRRESDQASALRRLRLARYVQRVLAQPRGYRGAWMAHNPLQLDFGTNHRLLATEDS